ncbi:MAG: rhomboid family intramembrane serine protease [Acidimicrobiaceae bacterium]|nr:rhomboid family intramembrane serine protease [Acidimicrobiaceae bacterium]
MSYPDAATRVCYRHPGRVAGAVCRRCERPICTECMRAAPVGWQCAECVRRDSRRSPVVRWRPGEGRLGNTRLTPVVIALIALNTVIYLASSGNRTSIEVRFGVAPLLIHQGEWYRLITGAFLHANLQHLLFNMFSLAIIGAPSEVLLGRTRFLATYLLAGLGGSVASYLFGSPNIVAVGASGAIFGLFGAYFVLARRRGFDLRTVSILIVINLVISFADPGVDWLGHLGGLVVGAVVAWAFDQTLDGREPVYRLLEVLTAGATLGALALLVLVPPGQLTLMR